MSITVFSLFSGALLGGVVGGGLFGALAAIHNFSVTSVKVSSEQDPSLSDSPLVDLHKKVGCDIEVPILQSVRRRHINLPQAVALGAIIGSTVGFMSAGSSNIEEKSSSSIAPATVHKKFIPFDLASSGFEKVPVVPASKVKTIAKVSPSVGISRA